MNGSRLRKAAALLLALLALLVPALAARGESLWGMEGIGRPLPPYDWAARGAGATAIGVIDPSGMSPANPAGIAFVRQPQADFDLFLEDRWITVEGSPSSRRLGDAGLSGARVALPLISPLRLGFYYRDVTDGGYHIARRFNEGREDVFTRTITGAGGVGEIAATLAAADPAGRVAVGLTAGWSQGTLRDEQADDFASGAYADGKNLLRTRLRGGRSLAAGVQIRLHPRLSVGGVWNGPVEYDMTSHWTTTSSVRWEESARLRIPAGFGLGASALLGSRHRLSADWNAESWGGARLHLTTPSEETGGGIPGGGFANLTDTRRIGVGYTRLPGETNPKDPLLRRAVWRAGFSRGELPVRQKGGAKVEEWYLSAGLGLPVQVDRGFINFALEVGRTGDLQQAGVREFFIRFGLGITFARLEEQF